MYDWIDNWARIPDTASGRENGRTHGICETRDGQVIVFHQAKNGLLTFSPEGELIRAVGGDRWVGAHGLTLMEDGGEEFLWLADQDSREVAKVTLDGETVMSIPKPDFDFTGTDYVPTWAAQNPDTGEVWVADGYGSHHLHRYDSDGGYLESIAGPKPSDTGGTSGRFKEPHGIDFTEGQGGLELWVTDRANHRIRVLDADGVLLRTIDTCHSPCCFSFRDGKVLVPELFTGVKVLDAETGALVSETGANDHVGPHPDPAEWWPPVAPENWPNLAGTDWVKPGTFNSPHGACFTANGDILVVEWIVGGRITKLVHRLR